MYAWINWASAETLAFPVTKNNTSLSKCWVLRTTCLWLCSDPVSIQPFPWNTWNLHVAVPCRLHPRKDYTQGKEHVSLHTWRSWVVLWHGCFKTAWVFLTCREYGQRKADCQCWKHLLPQCHMSWDRPMLLGRESYAGWFMNVRQYVLVNVQLVIWFQSSLSHETIATCTLLRPADCIQERIIHKERSTHFTLEEVGWFTDMSASRLLEYSSLVVSRVKWKGDWQCYKHLLPQCHMSWDRPMLLGWESYARVIHECSPVCACKCAACDLVSSKPFPHNTCNPAILLGPGTLHSTMDYTQGKEHFSLHTWRSGWFSDMAASRLPEYSSLIESTVNGKGLPILEASSATVSHARTVHAAGMGIICQGDSWMFHSTCLKGVPKNLVSSEPFP